jgi:phage terminase large subunit-like protein
MVKKGDTRPPWSTKSKNAPKPTSAQELAERVAALSEPQRRQLVARMRYEREVRRTTWLCPIPACDGTPHNSCPTPHARSNQRLPFKRDDGFVGALWVAGRGFGKTRIGAEGVRQMVTRKRNPAGRIGLIARTAADVRDVMIEGESGLLNVFPKWERPDYQPSKRRVTFSNGAVAFAYSSEDPDLLRGPQHDFIWGDEFSTWRRLAAVMSNALMGLRLGDDPRCILTGTPRPTKDVKKLVNNPKFKVIRGTTYENLANLAEVFRDTVISQYEGTRTGRQELNGELLLDVAGALLSTEVFERDDFRVNDLKGLDIGRITVNVDPAVTSSARSDYTGISVTAVDTNQRHGYVLYSESFKGSPAEAMKRVAMLYDIHMANCVVAEVNNGGDYVGTVLKQVRDDIPYKSVHAAVGKTARAEPVALLYEQSRIHHVGSPNIYAQLEDQWTSWIPKGIKDDEGNDIASDESPDEMDSVVWGFTHLMLPKRSRVVGPATTTRG